MEQKVKTKDGRIVTTYQFPVRPEKKSFSQMMYDKETGKIMGRTSENWGRLLLFYIIFYAVLAALIAVCMQGLLMTLNKEYPKWQLDESLIGTNPGISYRPIPRDENAEQTIKYSAANRTDVKIWVDLLNDFLLPYRDQDALPGGGKNQVICDFNTPPTGGNVCAFDVTKLGPCTAEEGYSYNKSAPCIFVKLNKIYGWIPEPYDNVNELPHDMPTDLVDHIKSLPENERKQVWISCNGLNLADSEAIGPLEYYPNRGFASYYYPYMNKAEYLNPLVAVHLARPTVKRNINIECRAWAKNVIYRGGHLDRQGSILLSLLIE
ncbi:sodium/potassium-transporting ATPase subunit beta-2-like [Topomyia yanbarensis]|uniref:sodium/potassium-transporting ATPase subunit beta-2-like n=1 Tax=Topomyia yanbarensis TaxID=2498891 RepID=UPI00273C3642|nr:sodium/potassium-transporting ATPase subunit beta-2-like [Topomyia yanbarensis]XP_058819352.1 sodium/potassium-transporting ATPase subunit beta-2-like [Topomyia yanbarensis]